MPYRDKQMLRDANGDLIPQYWDIQDGEFKPLTGQGGAQDTRLTGSNVEYENAIPVKEIGRAVEVIRNYSMTVVSAGNHSAGDVFTRGNNVPALNVSNYKDIMISIINNGVGTLAQSPKLRVFSSHGNIS